MRFSLFAAIFAAASITVEAIQMEREPVNFAQIESYVADNVYS